MTDRLLFRSSEIHAGQGVVDGYVVVAGGRIEDVAAGDPPAGAEGTVVDVRPHRLFPGLIDVHIHGAGGWSVEAGSADQIRALARFLAAWGVTAFQPSTAALPPEGLERVAVAVGEAMDDHPQDGARILGLHAEGPYLSPEKPGAMNADFFRDPSKEEIEHLGAVAPGTLRHLTIAPEQPGAVELIGWLAARGDVIVSGGHTDASYDQAQAGIDAGIRLSNHTYNAMRGLHQRDPGALGAFALDDRVTCELIADGRHVHPAAMEFLVRVASPERVCLVSDAVSPAGLPPGTYDLVGIGVNARITEEGFCVFPDGTLAGSARLLLHGVRTMVEEVGVPLEEAVRMASLRPAAVARVDGSKGSLEPGKDADLVVVSEAWEAVWTMVEGRVVRSPETPAPETNPKVAAR
ncbi:MAG TPA: N-acetylglucosamine-6-phosphate deacetylase [Actinomycetota bacterium]|nr:N-acetylglucosamine-6-phosphate deacetylase [Actinomycetota bacterium]